MDTAFQARAADRPPSEAAPPEPPPSRPGNAQILLGAFIVWQLFFLFAANVFRLLTEARDNPEHFPQDTVPVVEKVAPGFLKKEGQVHDLVEVITGLTKRWEQLTGQPQQWSLFAPGISSEATFVAVEFRWDEPADSARGLAPDLAALAAGNALEAVALRAAATRKPVMPHAPELMLSDNEPRDVNSYLRLGLFRLRKYESNLDVVLKKKENETEQQKKERWLRKIEDKMRRDWDCILAYLKWRKEAFKRAHPDLPPPRQVIMHVRRYDIPKPTGNEEPWGWDGPHSEPMARWQPPPDDRAGARVHWQAGFRELEMYNPVTGRFESMPR
jgi:hypothetical protein